MSCQLVTPTDSQLHKLAQNNWQVNRILKHVGHLCRSTQPAGVGMKREKDGKGQVGLVSEEKHAQVGGLKTWLMPTEYRSLYIGFPGTSVFLPTVR